MWLVKLPVLLITLSLWMFVGFVFWIPLLARSIATFSGVILYATLTKADTTAAGQSLQKSTTFYIEGFRRIIDSFDDDLHNVEPDRTPFKFWYFMGEILWAAIFWIGIAYQFNYLKFNLSHF